MTDNVLGLTINEFEMPFKNKNRNEEGLRNWGV